MTESDLKQIEERAAKARHQYTASGEFCCVTCDANVLVAEVRRLRREAAEMWEGHHAYATQHAAFDSEGGFGLASCCGICGEQNPYRDRGES